MRRPLISLVTKLTNRKLSLYVEDVRSINLNPFADDSISKRQKYLVNILNQARQHSAFYKEISLSNSANLLDFPVISKQVIKDNYSLFLSNKYKNLTLKEVKTSGSTGVPFKANHSPGKVSRNFADNIFFQKFVNYHLGCPIYYLRVWNESNKIKLVDRFAKNITPLNVAEMSDEVFDRIYRTIKKAPSNAIVLGYGSALHSFAEFLNRNSIKSEKSLGGVWVMAEALQTKQRQFLIDFYKCPVISRYSNSENGFIGHQFSNSSDAYLFNLASYEIELLNLYQDTPVNAGEIGRVVITDLFNEAVPFIRYDTGDIAKFDYMNFMNHSVKVFTSIEGRILDFIYSSEGLLISPHTIDYALREIPELLQFQFSQDDRNIYTVKLVAGNVDFNVLQGVVINALKKYLGSHACIQAISVQSIPKLPNGKSKLVINNFKTFLA